MSHNKNYSNVTKLYQTNPDRDNLNEPARSVRDIQETEPEQYLRKQRLHSCRRDYEGEYVFRRHRKQTETNRRNSDRKGRGKNNIDYTKQNEL